MKKLFARAAALFGSLLMLTGCSSGGGPSETTAPPDDPAVTGAPLDSEFKITSFDVGKGDALLLQTEGNAVMIDTGYQSDGKSLVKSLMKNGVSTINTLIITHFDKDHVGGAAKILGSLKVEEIYVPDYVSSTDEYKAFTEAAGKSDAKLNILPAKDKVEWQAGDVSYKLYAPNDTFYGGDEENDFSLTLYAEHGSNTFLFPGDAENARMKEIMTYAIGKVTFLKFPYHGNYMKTTEQFLDFFQPKVTIVTCSNKEYADPSTVETLQKRGVETYYMNEGDVTVVSDGSTLTCTQK